jgi:DamX protein
MRHDPSITTASDDPEPDEQQSEQVLQDYRQRYGLSIDPFGVDPYFPLFTGGQRRELLDHVIHCCEFSAGVPVVLGERGVGKTRIACALYEALGDSRACFIAALPTLDAQGLIAEIAQHFGVGGPSDSTAHYIDALRSFGTTQEGDGLTLVLIDDAHHLDDQTLAVLLELLQGRDPGEPGLQVVLFGDLTLMTRLHQLGSQQLPITDFYLERFTLGETVDYLNFRMEMADYLGTEMFTEAMVESWWRQAQGQLPAIHRQAREHLLEAVLPSISSGARPFPILHIVAIAVLGGAVLMTLLYQSDKSETPAEAQRVPISLQSPQVTTSTPPQSGTAVEPGTATNVNKALTVPVEPLPNVMGEESERVIEVVPPPTDSQLSEPIRRVTTQALEPKVVRESVVVSEAPIVQPAPAPAPVSAAHRLSGDEETLLSWRPTDFTLQLLGVSTEKAAKDYITSQPNRDDLLMFKTVRQGKDWFVVVAGRYETSAAAKNAVKGLPQEQIKAGPWARELGVIQREIQR